MNKHIEKEKVVFQNSTKKMEEIRQFARFLKSTVSATRPFGRSAENVTKKNRENDRFGRSTIPRQVHFGGMQFL